MNKLILTKKRLKALDLALTMDDILYAKFDRMYTDFKRHCEQFNRRKYVIRVVQKKKTVNYVLQIIKETKTPEGIFLEVK